MRNFVLMGIAVAIACVAGWTTSTVAVSPISMADSAIDVQALQIDAKNLPVSVIADMI